MDGIVRRSLHDMTSDESRGIGPAPNTGTTMIGVAGGSGSGKTTLCRKIVAALGPSRVVSISFDDYYRDLSHLHPTERSQQNFDHPDALDDQLLSHHLDQLSRGRGVDLPVYDFAEHRRCEETRRIEPADFVLVEGVLTFSRPQLRELFALRVFVEASEEVRFERRFARDVRERGREPSSVRSQWQQSVKPMHDVHVEPSRRHAHVVVPMHDANDVAVDLIVFYLESSRRSLTR